MIDGGLEAISQITAKHEKVNSIDPQGARKNVDGQTNLGRVLSPIAILRHRPPAEDPPDLSHAEEKGPESQR